MPHAIEQQLYVNDGPLDPAGIARLQPSDPTLPLEELRKRFNENGYLYLKGILPRTDVLKAREAYFKFLAPSGVLKDGTEPVAGIFDSAKDISRFPGIGVGRVDGDADPEKESRDFVSLALDAHGQPWYAEALCKHPVLLDFASRFTGWGPSTRLLERTLLRNNIPGAQAIGVHYDQIFLRYGEPTSITAWVPMGDIGIDGGGLIYLENGEILFLGLFILLLRRKPLPLTDKYPYTSGHHLGKEIEDQFTSKAKASGLSDEEAKSAFNKNMLESGVLTDGPAEFGRIHNRRWLVSDYEAGDVVLHTSYMVRTAHVDMDIRNHAPLWVEGLISADLLTSQSRFTHRRSTMTQTVSSGWQPICDLLTLLGRGTRCVSQPFRSKNFSLVLTRLPKQRWSHQFKVGDGL